MSSAILPKADFFKDHCLFGIAGIVLLFFIFSCGTDAGPQKKQQEDPKKFKGALERVNKYEVQKESDEINQYILRHNWTMEKTGTGLRYIIIEKGKGAQPKSGDFVSVNYKISLLDGTVCYSSDKDGSKEFKVEGDNVESGLHQAALLMHIGDKAKFILPSYMANGLQSDNDQIPPLSAIVVDMELLAVNPN